MQNAKKPQRQEANSPTVLTVGDHITSGNGTWAFTGDVCENFDSHVQKSVPLYLEGHNLVKDISHFFISNNTLCYEVGCSTAKLLSTLASEHKNKQARFVGIDVVPDMVRIGKARCKEFKNVEVLCADACTFEFEKSDLIVAYYTMQFIPPRLRQILFDKFFESLNWGGAFILFEKVRSPDARFQDLSTQLYNEYKISKGYSPDEILGKARSLKGILEPFSSQGNIDLLRRAGFVDYTTVMKYVCFEGILAIK